MSHCKKLLFCIVCSVLVWRFSTIYKLMVLNATLEAVDLGPLEVSFWLLIVEKVSTGLGDVFHDILAVLHLAICESDDLASKHLLDLFCPSIGLAIKDCFPYLKLKKGLSLLQAIKATRLHLVGLLVCDDLSSYTPAKSIAILLESNHLTLEGMHSILKFLAATKNDSKNMGLRDVIVNIL